jgi:hypothetical protein
MRALFVALPMLAGAILITARNPPARADAPVEFLVVEATIPQMRQAMEDRRVTSHALVTQYLTPDMP